MFDPLVPTWLDDLYYFLVVYIAWHLIYGFLTSNWSHNHNRFQATSITPKCKKNYNYHNNLPKVDIISFFNWPWKWIMTFEHKVVIIYSLLSCYIIDFRILTSCENSASTKTDLASMKFWLYKLMSPNNWKEIWYQVHQRILDWMWLLIKKIKWDVYMNHC
jgi:hypothetical protein